jgi:hypothetical protein
MAMFSGVPDWERAEDALKKFNEEYGSNDYDPVSEYLQLSRFIQALFISYDGYVIDTGNFRTVNRAILKDILKRVKKHPEIWQLFMVC